VSLVTLFPCVLYYIRYEGYQEALESEKKKEVELEAMKEQFSGMQSQIQSLIMAFANMKEQTQFDSMAKTLYDSHILGKEATSAPSISVPTIIPTDSLESEEHLKDIYIL
jgi:hypothetical protein